VAHITNHVFCFVLSTGGAAWTLTKLHFKSLSCRFFQQLSGLVQKLQTVLTPAKTSYKDGNVSEKLAFSVVVTGKIWEMQELRTWYQVFVNTRWAFMRSQRLELCRAKNWRKAAALGAMVYLCENQTLFRYLSMQVLESAVRTLYVNVGRTLALSLCTVIK